jgi:ribosome-associated protein YbcJ (S4-like RNA binding protein)
VGENMEVNITSEYIRLGQLLKLVDLIRSGGEEKMFVLTHFIQVNGVQENRRGRKLYPGDVVVVDQQTYTIT